MTSTQDTPKVEPDMNMQFTHSVETTKEEVKEKVEKEEVNEKVEKEEVNEKVEKEKVEKEKVETTKEKVKEEVKVEVKEEVKEKVEKEEKSSINTLYDDDDDDDEYSNQVNVDPRYLLMDQYAYAQIAFKQNKSQEAFNNLEIIREKMKVVGITMMS